MFFVGREWVLFLSLRPIISIIFYKKFSSNSCLLYNNFFYVFFSLFQGRLHLVKLPRFLSEKLCQLGSPQVCCSSEDKYFHRVQM